MYGRHTKGFAALLVTGLLCVGLLLGLNIGLVVPQAASAQAGVSNFTTIAASRDVHVGGDVLTDGFVVARPAPLTVLANGDLFTPTATLHPISSTVAAGVSGADIALQPAGTLLILLNVGSQTITFTETGTLISAGNIALGAGDSATLISSGTDWVQVAGSNN